MKIAEAANDVIEGYAIMGKRPFKVRRFSQIAGKLWMGGFPVGQAPEDLQFVVNLHPAIGYGMHPKQILTCAIFMDGEELPEEKLLYLLARHVNECRQHGTTLVHCQMGLNRSALVVALALILDGQPPADAIALLRARRGDAVLCNEYFEKWLLARNVGR